MHFDGWTLALQTINFAVLVWLLQRFLYKPVLRVIDARRAELEKQVADAKATEARAKRELEAIESERGGIEAQRSAALTAAAAEAEKAAAARRERAEREAAALVDGARKGIAEERGHALAEARRAALDLGIDVARRLLAEVPAELREEAWLERVESHLAGLAPEQRSALGHREGALRVVTAAALSEPLQQEWSERLERALGDGITIAFEADPALVAGADLHFPDAILRFSWQSALASLRAEIEADADAR